MVSVYDVCEKKKNTDDDSAQSFFSSSNNLTYFPFLRSLIAILKKNTFFRLIKHTKLKSKSNEKRSNRGLRVLRECLAYTHFNEERERKTICVCNHQHLCMHLTSIVVAPPSEFLHPLRTSSNGSSSNNKSSINEYDVLQTL